MIDRLKVVALTAGAFVLLAGAASAQTSAMNKCQGSKIKDAGKKAACVAGLEAKVAAAGGSVDPTKLAKCQAKVGAAFTKLEAKPGCGTTGDGTAIENKVDAFVNDLVTELSVGGPNKCQGAKIKDAGKKAACLAGLEAKFIASGAALDPAKVAKCDAKVGAAYAKLDAKGPCNTTGDATAIENKVDAFVDDLTTELNQAGGGGGGCCAAARITTVSSNGTLVVSTLPAFPFPPNVQTVIEVGAADSGCKHTGIIPSGGFSVPVFCIPGLMYTSSVTPTGCAAGGADGQAVVWDNNAPTSDPNVTRVGDTSDGVCNPAGETCNTATGGAGANTLGDINTSRGGSPSHTGKIDTQVDIPVDSLTWQAADLSCPDSDGMYNPGTDTPITHFQFILSPTTGLSSATFTDLNGDSCSRAGNGPNSQTATGAAASGPCCVVGQATTVASTGVAFSGGAPLYDLSFKSITPTTISACGTPSSAESCTLTTDPCLD